jgi:hypothetical protein
LSRSSLQDGTDADSVNHHFIRAALPHLVPLLLEQLTKQEEGQEADDGVWNVAMAAGTCLALCASVAEDAVVPLVMPYVTANIQKTDGPESWRAREAATFAFGSILEGPGVDTLGQLVQSGLGFLLTALKQDPSAYVKDTTAWTIGAGRAALCWCCAALCWCCAALCWCCAALCWCCAARPGLAAICLRLGVLAAAGAAAAARWCKEARLRMCACAAGVHQPASTPAHATLLDVRCRRPYL